MADVFGTVTKITSTPRGARGSLAYSVQMDNGEWYGHGFDVPKFQEGQQVSFNIAYNGQYKNVDVGSVQVTGGAPQQQSAGQQPATAGRMNGGNTQGGGYQKKAGGKDKYWEDKAKDDKARQACIEHQSSRNASIALLGVLMENDAIKLPAKAADKFDAAMAIVDEMTAKFNYDLHPDKSDAPLPGVAEHHPNEDYQPPHAQGYQE